MDKDESIILTNSYNIEISETNEDPSYLKVKFIICDFDTNANNVKLNRDTIDDWINTLLLKPVVGKIQLNKDNELDFTSHQAKKIISFDENGNLSTRLKFGTDMFGNFESVQIENIDGVDYITANARIYKRFEECCKIIQDRYDNNEPLSSSWEVLPTNYTMDGNVKVINKGVFLAHAILSKYTTPAYQCSKMLEVAEEENNEDELTLALLKDLIKLNEIEISESKDSQSENNSVDNKLNEIEINEGGHEIMAEENKNVEISALSLADIRGKVQKAVYSTEGNGRYYWGVIVYPYDYLAYAHIDNQDSNEDDYVKFTYVVNSDDTISITNQEDVKMVFVPKTISDTQIAEIETKLNSANEMVAQKDTEIASKNEEIIKLGDSIKSLETSISEKDKEIAELQPIKEKYEQEVAEKEAKELAEKQEALKNEAISSQYVSEKDFEENETLKTALSELDDKTIKAFIAEKVIEVNSKKAEEISEKGNDTNVEISSVELSSTQEYNYASELASDPLYKFLNKKNRRRY